jgi:hypothetical protein
MTATRIAQEFAAIREFIEQSPQAVAKKFRNQAIAQTLYRLDRLRDKMLDTEAAIAPLRNDINEAIGAKVETKGDIPCS